MRVDGRGQAVNREFRSPPATFEAQPGTHSHTYAESIVLGRESRHDLVFQTPLLRECTIHGLTPTGSASTHGLNPTRPDCDSRFTA